MKYLILVIISMTMGTTIVSPQIKDSLIQLTPLIGDTITYSENQAFNLYRNIHGFRYAVLYIRSNDSLVNHIYYATDKEELRDTVIIQKIGLLGNKRAYVRQKSLEIYGNNDAKLIAVFTNYGTYTGNLLFVNDKKLILKSTEIIEKGEDDFLSIPTKEINHILIPGNSNVGAGIGFGFLSGFAIGFLIGAADVVGKTTLTNDTGAKGIMGGIVFGLVGLILGTVIGTASSSSEESIEVNSDYDFNELKKYSRFPTVYPGFHKSTE